MQNTALFKAVKIDHFHMKCDTFLILAQNMDGRYTLEPPHLKEKTNTPVKFYCIKVGC